MLQKRIVVCLDVKDGQCTKGVQFKGNQVIGDPVEMAKAYYEQGADELVFYDITASSDRRNIMLDVVANVAQNIFIPFCVGGGIRTMEDMRAVLLGGAEKISVNSAAVLNPDIINQGARQFGNQCIVLGMDVKADSAFPSGYGVVINGGRKPTDKDALAWALEAQERGAGEIVLNSIDADGMKRGYDLAITSQISQKLSIPVVASGGAGLPEHLASVLTTGCADAALIASMVHYGEFSIKEIKSFLREQNIPVRL